MASLATHKAGQATAAAAYATAATNFVNAYVELAAYDKVVENSGTGGGYQPSFGEGPVIPSHPIALPVSPAPAAHAFGDRIRTRLIALINS